MTSDEFCQFLILNDSDESIPTSLMFSFEIHYKIKYRINNDTKAESLQLATLFSHG